MKKLRKALAAISIFVVVSFTGMQAASAGIIAPQISADGDAALWNCSGPYYNWSLYKYEYWCYYDYTWFAEVFKGKHDYWGYADAWYTA